MLKGAVIGLGRIGWGLENDVLRMKPATHVGAMLDNRDIELVAVCDIDTEKLKAFNSLYPSAKVYDNFEELVENETINILTIATPDKTHAPIVETILKDKNTNDLKVILCEKPISTNTIQAKIMINWCKDKNIKLAINHTRRWMPEYQSVKRTIDFGDYGKPVLFVGYYYDGIRDFCHLADLYNWLTPGVEYSFHRIDAEYLIFEQDIFFEKGRIRISDNARDIRYYKSDKSWFYENINELRQSFKTESKQIPTPISLVYKDLVKCALTNKQPECTGEDGLRALKLSLDVLGGYK